MAKLTCSSRLLAVALGVVVVRGIVGQLHRREARSPAASRPARAPPRCEVASQAITAAAMASTAMLRNSVRRGWRIRAGAKSAVSSDRPRSTVVASPVAWPRARGLDGQHLLQLVHQLVDGGVAVGGLLRRGALHHGGQSRGDLGPAALDVGQRLAHVLHGHRHLGVGLERHLSGQHLVEHDAQRVDVRLLGHLVPERLLGGDVIGGAEHAAGGGQARAPPSSGRCRSR